MAYIDQEKKKVGSRIDVLETWYERYFQLTTIHH